MVAADRCLSVKNKRSKAQCPHKRKAGSDYCGIHRRCKNIIRVECADNKPASKYLHQVLKIQSAYRNWHRYRRTRCINKTDFCTLDNLTDIPLSYFFTYQDINNGFWYGFDVRSLVPLTKNPAPRNPYTRTVIPSKVIDRFGSRCEDLVKRKFPLCYDPPKLNKHQKMMDRMLSVFQKIDMLGNYTDYDWFRKLSSSRLRKLYRHLQDIWIYRTNMSLTQRKRVVHDGKVFNLDPLSLRGRTQEELRYLLLGEFDRMVTEGVNQNERVLGAMLVLTGLVQVSSDAARALPQYTQISF